MPPRKNLLRAIALKTSQICLLAVLLAAPLARSEPALFRSTIRIEPTLSQIESLPTIEADWSLPPPLAAKFREVLIAGKFSAAFSEAAFAALSIEPATGIGHITPTPELLDLLPQSKRLHWWAILGTYSPNRSYRWPIALAPQQIEALATDVRFSEAVNLIRRWGVQTQSRLLFADLFALEAAFPNQPTRNEFFQQLLGSNTEFLKQISDTTDPATIDADARYWESESRNREIEPFITAIARVDGHDRIDIAHLLPRLPRSLLYTYPPSLEVAEEPSAENAAMAAAFFSSSADSETQFPNGFSEWLEQSCQAVSGTREYGDIIVFEDPSLTPGPFSMVYIADGIVFGRRPNIYGPWEFLPEDQVRLLNPKLQGGKTTVYRQIRDVTPSSQSPRQAALPRVPPLSDAPRLVSLPAGPWGNLKYYQLPLSPTHSLLATLPEPSEKPVWKFVNTTASKLRNTLASIEMPATAREQLASLFAQARPDSKGAITLYPSTELVLATPPEVREKLFSQLLSGSNATDYTQDCYFPTSLSPEEWFAPAILSDEARRIILQLTYRQENALRLSDYGAFYHSIKDPDERLAAVQAVMSTPVVILLLEKPSLEDVPQIADYWRIHQQKSVRSLLESFAQSENMDYLDITHLLPPLARELSNIYLRAGYDTPTPSCYWSALNFDAERPDPRLLVVPANPTKQVSLVWQKLRQEYRRVEQATQLGDIVVYRSRVGGDVLHVCAFIAADIVFTKNGYGSSSPWCLMRLEEVDSLYLTSDAERWAYTRKE